MGTGECFAAVAIAIAAENPGARTSVVPEDGTATLPSEDIVGNSEAWHKSLSVKTKTTLCQVCSFIYCCFLICSLQQISWLYNKY